MHTRIDIYSEMCKLNMFSLTINKLVFVEHNFMLLSPFHYNFIKNIHLCW